MNSTITRIEYHAQLAASFAETEKFGGNQAIRNHRDKVASMSDAEFEGHRAKMIAMQPQAAAMAKKMAAQLMPA